MRRLYETGLIVSCPDSGGNPNATGGRELGKLTKKFCLTAKQRRKIRASSIRLALQKAKHRKLLFCTLTFPQPISSHDANKCLSNYLDNLTTNFKLKDYVITRELHKSGVPHYHCIFDIPYYSYKRLNNSWCASFRQFMQPSVNAFRTGKNPRIQSVKAVSAYISKYITKADETAATDNSARLYFISLGCLFKPSDISENSLIYLVTKFKNTVYVGDHFTVYQLNDFECLPEWYADKKSKLLDTSPDEPPPKNDDLQPQIDFFSPIFNYAVKNGM
jgi:hypothetical protein